MDKNQIALLIVILEIALIILCLWYIVYLFTTEGANYGATSTEEMESAAKGTGKGQAEKGVTGTKIPKRGRKYGHY